MSGERIRRICELRRNYRQVFPPDEHKRDSEASRLKAAGCIVARRIRQLRASTLVSIVTTALMNQINNERKRDINIYIYIYIYAYQLIYL